MERLTGEQRDVLWRCLVAYSSDPIHSAELTDERGSVVQTLTRGFDAIDDYQRRSRGSGELTFLDTTSLGMGPGGNAVLRYLAALEPGDRRLIIRRHLANLEAKEDEASPLATLERQMERHFGTGVVQVFEPLHSLVRPRGAGQDPSHNLFKGMATALALVVALIGVAALGRFAFSAPPPEDSIALLTTLVPPPPTYTQPAELRAVELEALVSDPARKIQVFIDEDHFVVREDPETGRVIWRSGPHRSATIHRIDANTLTLDRPAKRVYLSLEDGTVLPP